MQYTDNFSAVKFEKCHHKKYIFSPWRGGSNEHPQSMFWIRNKDQRVNGPVNDQLRSAAYTNEHV